MHATRGRWTDDKDWTEDSLLVERLSALDGDVLFVLGDDACSSPSERTPTRR